MVSPLMYDAESGQYLCCICLEWTDFGALYLDKNDSRWDVCSVCGALEGYDG